MNSIYCIIRSFRFFQRQKTNRSLDRRYGNSIEIKKPQTTLLNKIRHLIWYQKEDNKFLQKFTKKLCKPVVFENLKKKSHLNFLAFLEWFSNENKTSEFDAKQTCLCHIIITKVFVVHFWTPKAYFWFVYASRLEQSTTLKLQMLLCRVGIMKNASKHHCSHFHTTKLGKKHTRRIKH